MTAMDFSGRRTLDCLKPAASGFRGRDKPWDSSLRPALQRFSQCPLHLFQLLRRQLLPVRGEIEDIDRHLPFGVDESNFDVALVMGEAGGHRVQEPWTVLCDHPYQRAVGRALAVELNRGLDLYLGRAFLLLGLHAALQHSIQIRFPLSFAKILWRQEINSLDNFLAVKLASEWHKMPHRQYLLRDLAPTLMLEDEETLKYLSARKAEWAKLRQGTEKSRQNMEFFLARFDPANYTKTPQEDGRVLITMRWPSELEEIAQKFQGEMNLRMLFLTLATRCRRLLEGQETLRVEEVPEFAAQLQRLANWKDPREDGSQEHYRINSIAGGLAVLVILHRSWLAENADLENWCLTTLRELKPVASEHFSPHAIDNHGAEAFLGEAGVALLQESSEEWVLRMAFEGVTGSSYSSTLFTVWRAYVLRQQLGGRFGELLNVVVLWSALRLAAIRESGYYADTAHLDKYREYAADIAKKSGVEFPSETLELGYVAVSPDHRGHHLSQLHCEGAS